MTSGGAILGARAQCEFLGGGIIFLKNVQPYPIPGDFWIQFDGCIFFQMGWLVKNHKPGSHFSGQPSSMASQHDGSQGTLLAVS